MRRALNVRAHESGMLVTAASLMLVWVVVLRLTGAGTGKFDKFYPKEGHFACAACAQPLYSAAAKFDSGCGCKCCTREPMI